MSYILVQTPSKTHKTPSQDTIDPKRLKITKETECMRLKVSEMSVKYNSSEEPYEYSLEVSSRFDYSDEEWEYVKCCLGVNTEKKRQPCK